jgi:hypothetical protein
VNLASGTNEIQLAVGMQMRREEEGPWRLASDSGSTLATAKTEVASTGQKAESRATAVATNSEDEGAEKTAEASDPTPSSSTTDDPVLKRLMQKREQEMNR